MAISIQRRAGATSTASHGRQPPNALEGVPERQMARWGGVAGTLGAVLLVGAGAVVGILGLPDASDVETLTDFSDIESGRIAEHFLYLGALMLLALHVLVLHRLLRDDHPPAAMFGAATAEFGLVIMAASSLLHVATSPLADLYTEPGTSPDDLRSIEYAWHAGQSVFDTMLATGVLLVPIGMLLLGTAMRAGSMFRPSTAVATIVLGIVGTLSAVIAVVDPGSMFSALAVLAIVIFGLMSGRQMLRMAKDRVIDLDESGSALTA